VGLTGSEGRTHVSRTLGSPVTSIELARQERRTRVSRACNSRGRRSNSCVTSVRLARQERRTRVSRACDSHGRSVELGCHERATRAAGTCDSRPYLRKHPLMITTGFGAVGGHKGRAPARPRGHGPSQGGRGSRVKRPNEGRRQPPTRQPQGLLRREGPPVPSADSTKPTTGNQLEDTPQPPPPPHPACHQRRTRVSGACNSPVTSVELACQERATRGVGGCDSRVGWGRHEWLRTFRRSWSVCSVRVLMRSARGAWAARRWAWASARGVSNAATSSSPRARCTWSTRF
jgi:hypothetical protein